MDSVEEDFAVLFTIDRVQFSYSKQQYYFYEFMEIPNIKLLIMTSNFWETLYSMINDIERKKLTFLLNNQLNTVKIFIFYQRGVNCFIKIEINPHLNQTFGNVWEFKDIQKWFRGLNNIDGDSRSKGLGATKSENIDYYVNGLLRLLYDKEDYQDDNGLELTKKLLDGDTTKGFDLDLLQYIQSTNEYIIYEFLKRENSYISNIQAHPMRYCWTGRRNDNKQKFISLWNIKQFLNGRLFLINYSDDDNERVSIIEVLDLDANKGILEEKKYCMSKNVFIGWLRDMNHYSSSSNNYLADFKCVHYDKQFFRNFNDNKKRYGSEFLI